MKHRTLATLASLWPLVAFFPGTLTASEPFGLATRIVDVPESGPVTNLVLSTARHEFTFLPPRDWGITVGTTETKLTWTSRDRSSMISLTIVTKDNEQTPEIHPAEWRQTILQRNPGATITEEFTCYSSELRGLGMDAEFVQAGTYATCTRVAIVPFKGGLAEFDLTAPKAQFAKQQLDLGFLLNSFRVEPRSPKDASKP